MASTPFDNIQSVVNNTVVAATEPQLERAIKPMLADRNWTAGPAKYSHRIAAINVVLSMLDGGFTLPDDSPLLEVMAAEMPLGEKLNWALAICSTTCEEGYEFAYAPLTKQGASKLIDWLGGLEFKAKNHSKVEEANVEAAKAANTPAPTQEDVPAGRYAIATDDGAINELAFYKVDRPTEGRWAGRVFVKHLVGPEEQRLSWANTKAVLAKIAAAGPAEASAAYGHEIGECGVCGRRLTNDESRERGIGPICVEKMGW